LSELAASYLLSFFNIRIFVFLYAKKSKRLTQRKNKARHFRARFFFCWGELTTYI